ncbi:DUF6998 domain-containing protein [Burkholderia sp. MBR-1]|uniref:DUF6998 domain-containing protein n=1 Tax=Burkholderia sp. MBR-1 TaxID=2732364 RepID=UPI0015EE7A9C|nr:hypothetical protein [Burkholderia sp. MBR-1]QMI49890.1 hypothetical protein MBR110_31005 [Burkholderia sp. MBR-1]
MPPNECGQAKVQEAGTVVTVLRLPLLVRDLWNAQQALVQHYADTGLRFTFDGRLVGDIAEAVALEHFDLVVPKKRTPGVDALTRSGKTVQIKASGANKSGPAFTPGKGIADFLLFFHIDFSAGLASVVYNGPEAPVRALLPAQWTGTQSVRLTQVRALAAAVDPVDALPLNVAQIERGQESAMSPIDQPDKGAASATVGAERVPTVPAATN